LVILKLAPSHSRFLPVRLLVASGGLCRISSVTLGGKSRRLPFFGRRRISTERENTRQTNARTFCYDHDFSQGVGVPASIGRAPHSNSEHDSTNSFMVSQELEENENISEIPNIVNQQCYSQNC
jgi:hypothetical protein